MARSAILVVMKEAKGFTRQKSNRFSGGFTVVELLVAIAVLTAIGLIFLSQKNTLESIHRDKQRKTAINAIYYNLEEVVKPALGGYPTKLDAKQLKAMDSELLKDPWGKSISESVSNYRYEATGCNGGTVCTGYILRANLEREADFVKTNR